VLIGQGDGRILNCRLVPRRSKAGKKGGEIAPFEKGGEVAPKIIPFISSQKPDEASAVKGRLRTRLVANQNKEHLVCHIRL
jgi:hypothetical protein